MNSIELFAIIFIVGAIAGIAYMTVKYFSVDKDQLRTKKSPILHADFNEPSNLTQVKSKNYVSEVPSTASDTAITENKNRLSNEKFDGSNLNPEHKANNKMAKEAEHKKISEAIKKGETFDIANESAVNQPNDNI